MGIIIALCFCLLAEAQSYVFQQLPNREQMSDSAVVQILQDPDGMMWYATHGDGIYSDDGYETTRYGAGNGRSDALPDAHVGCMTLDRSGNIWFGTHSGAYVLNRCDGSFTLLTDTEGESVHCIFQRKNGEMWVALLGVALRYTAEGSFVNSYPLTYEGMPATALCMVEDARNHLCISFEEGILCAFDDAHDEMLLVDWPFSKAPSAMAMDTKHHCLWIGTLGLGIVKFDAQNNFIRQFDSLAGEGIDSDKSFVFDILFDKTNSIVWATTSEGLFAYSVVDGELVPMESDAFRTMHSNVSAEDTIPHHLSIDRDGRLWFTDGIGKICVLSQPRSSDEIVQNGRFAVPVAVKVVFDEIEEYCPNKQVKIPAGTRKAIVYLSTFDFLSVSSIRFSYRLKGTETWTDLEPGTNRVELNGPFDAGSYVLLVRVSDGKGKWGEEMVCLTLNVEGAWWKQINLFLLLLALFLLAAVVYVVVRFVVRPKLDAQKETETSVVVPHPEIKKREETPVPQKQPLASVPPIQPLATASPKQPQTSVPQKQPRSRETEDKMFLRQLNKLMNKHLAETDYNVEKLSTEMQMSRMSLYRRVQSLTGLNPAEYFRQRRLERAAELLETTSQPVAAISARTGFATPRTFSKSFKEKYGLSPSEFRDAKVKS